MNRAQEFNCPLNSMCPFTLDADEREHARWHLSRRRSPVVDVVLQSGHSYMSGGVSITNTTGSRKRFLVYEEDSGGIEALTTLNNTTSNGFDTLRQVWTDRITVQDYMRGINNEEDSDD